jgi:hypothetical protein
MTLLLLGTHRAAVRAQARPRHSMQRLGRRLGFGKAGQSRVRRGGTSWSPARGQPVDHLRVVPACLLTCQHRGKGLRSPVRHRHGEDPLGIPTARRARRRRRGRTHGHPLLETATAVAAILVGGHATLQDATVGGVGTGRLFYARALPSSSEADAPVSIARQKARCSGRPAPAAGAGRPGPPASRAPGTPLRRPPRGVPGAPYQVPNLLVSLTAR